MGCFYPLAATQLPGGQIQIHKRTPGIPVKATPAGLGRDIKLPCGNCIGCRIQRSSEWATRCLHESQQHTANCFATLTIAPEHLAAAAPNGSLSKRTHQLFVKRLRSTIGDRISYYMCGEYGEQLSRPHYHYLIFGYDFSDKVFHKTSNSGEKLYTSPTLNLLWPHGKAWLGQVTYESCAYVASYVMKKLSGPLAWDHYRRTDEAGNDFWLEPEFNEMSRRPAIAHDWWQEFHADVLVDDVIVKRGGGKIKPPRYYDKLLGLMDPAALALIKLRREQRAKELEADNTPQRLADKEIVQKAKLKIKHRNLENSIENGNHRPSGHQVCDSQSPDVRSEHERSNSRSSGHGE